ncbi:S8 family serine peptidase [Halonotius sp. F2-221B]|uniref:S8 family peptidase n=1 Tax=Halonotius sp. F2-221B TaxID=2731620 RepID=UPI00398BA33B
MLLLIGATGTAVSGASAEEINPQPPTIDHLSASSADALQTASDRPPADEGLQSVPESRTVTPSIIGPRPATNTTAALELLRVNEVWTDFDTRGENTTVAVLDSGVAIDAHQSLTLADDGWKDFVSNRSDPIDNRNHGTITSGVVVGNETPDGTHFGVAPNATLLHGKVIDGDGTARTTNVLQGVEWAISHPQQPDVILINVGHKRVYYDRYIEAIERARAAGIYVVVPAGNEGDGGITSPGSVYSALSVGATNATGAVEDYSVGNIISTRARWGARPIYEYDWPESYVVPTVVAPATTISTTADGGFRHTSGTSFAAPHAAGVVALMQAASDRQLTPAEIDRALLETARYPGQTPPDTRYGYGVIDGYDAVAAVADRPPYFAVTRLTHDGPTEHRLGRNEPVSFEATIKNVGNVTDSQLVIISVDGDRVGSRRVTLNGTITTTIRGTRGIACAAPRTSSITVTTANTSLSIPVDVCRN